MTPLGLAVLSSGVVIYFLECLGNLFKLHYFEQYFLTKLKDTFPTYQMKLSHKAMNIRYLLKFILLT